MKLLSSWDDEYPASDSLSILWDLAGHHLVAAKALPDHHPSILDLEFLLEKKDVRGLCLYDMSYETLSNEMSVFHARQILGFFQKNPELDIGVDREQVAYDKFVESEAGCRETNSILKLWSRGDFCFHPRVEAQLFRAQRKIAQVLGLLPPLEKVGLRFGPGSTTSTKRRMASVREKLHARMACSEDLAPLAQSMVDEMPLWAELQSELQSRASLSISVDVGKVTFVPKSAKTLRAVVTEPVLNGMLQLGYGDIISKRLRAVGIDTRDQTLNQRLALEGSRTGALATLDLSSASDTISYELVYHLLPLDWASALSRCRTGKVSLRGEIISQAKFSSMGNGYTFPLETLIFWALARSCCSDRDIVSVYGDDIIVPSYRAQEVSRLLQTVGFSVNTSKSYSHGFFRESCGKDYYKGIDIRPFYQKSLVGPASLFILHNFYVRYGLDDFAERVRSLIHPSLRIFGPDGYGDGHLLGDPPLRPHKRNIGYGGYLFSTFTWKARRDIRPVKPGDWIVPLYSIYLRDRDPEPLCNTKGVHGIVRAEAARPGFTYPGKRGYKRISIDRKSVV